MFNHLQSLPQATAPIIFVSNPPVFDGKDGSISFLDFAQELQNHSDWTGDPSATYRRMEDILPAHLYGPALRYYESLHPILTQDWDRLRDVMAFRFPGPLRSGGLVRRSTTRWEEDGLQTVPEAPPPPASPLITPARTATKQDRSIHILPKPKKPFIYVIALKDKLRLPSFNRSPSPNPKSFHGQHPQVTVHSLYIESDYGGTIWSPGHYVPLEAKIDLDDHLTVSAAKKQPLITIASSHAKGYRIGFVYSVTFGKVEISFWHKILAPKEFSMLSSRNIGFRSVSPVGLISDAHSITEFIYDRAAYVPNYERASPGQYMVKSHIHVGRSTSNFEDVGEITWRIDII